ncbi:YeeE/YedE family protein [Candidatus Bathyarchaeota archaeon]|nr:YeeE/YedE family protein [Candidatus Bathyarchaeota archaeon]
MFPNGINSYLIGGIIIGLSTSLVYILLGIHATQSTFFATTLSYLFPKIPYFNQKNYLEQREWRIAFAVGVVLGALVYTMTLSNQGFWMTDVQLWRLLIGGILVGFGVRMSSGCTSGHGISGLASLSTTSLYAVITFIGVGIIVAKIVELMGVVP